MQGKDATTRFYQTTMIAELVKKYQIDIRMIQIIKVINFDKLI